jgi:TRAP-type mannitol/chloroaromatic compound transport system permease small subunit
MTQPPMTPNYQSNLQPQSGGGGGLALTALILGIIGVVLFCVPVLPWLLGLAAIVLGVVAMNQAGAGPHAGKAKAGLILGIVALVLSIGFWFAARAGLSFMGKKIQQGTQQMQQQISDAEKKAQEQRDQYQREHPNSTTEPTSAP